MNSVGARPRVPKAYAATVVATVMVLSALGAAAGSVAASAGGPAHGPLAVASTSAPAGAMSSPARAVASERFGGSPRNDAPPLSVGPTAALASTATLSSSLGSSVGNSNDDVASVSGGLIGSDIGSFPAILGLTSETGGPGVPPFQNASCLGGDSANCYSLQINSNVFVTSSVYGSNLSTKGWEQYIYSNPAGGGGAVIYIEFWMLGYDAAYGTCPTTGPSGLGSWNTYQGNCYADSTHMSVPTNPISNLANLTLKAYANYGGSGNDVVTLCVTGGSCYSNPIQDNIVNLYQHWDQAEFNIIGDTDGSGAYFNAGTSLELSNAVTDGSGNPLTTSCVNNGTTGESNNLFLGPCSTSGSSIVFTESSQIYQLSASPAAVTVLAGGTADFTIGFSSAQGTAAPVALSVASGAPGGSLTGFAPSSITPTAGTSTLSVATSVLGSLGDFTVTVQGQFELLVETVTVQLHIYDFVVEIAPASQTLVRGLTATYAFNLTLLPGSSTTGLPASALAFSGLPGDAVVTLSASSATPTLQGCSFGTLADCLTLVVATAGAPTGSLGDFTPIVSATTAGPTGGARSASASLHLFDFTVTLSPATLTLAQGASAPATVSVGLVAGSSTVGLPAVSLGLAGVPTGVSAVGFPASLPIGGSQGFTLATSGSGGYVSCPQVSPSGGQNLAGANLAHCNLAGYHLSGDNLKGADLEDANLAGVSFLGDNLQGADLASANTAGATFQGTNLKGADLSAAGALGTFVLVATGTAQTVSRSGTLSLTVLGDQLSGSTFQGANMQDANLASDVLVGASFQGTNLKGADLQNADLMDASFQGANLQGANLTGANLSGTSFKGANLRRADLRGSDLAGADLAGARLHGADLRGADLSGADLQSAELQRANLQGADLRGADLVGANLKHAKLQSADLGNASLIGANLLGADLSNANLAGADLLGAYVPLFGAPAAAPGAASAPGHSTVAPAGYGNLSAGWIAIFLLEGTSLLALLGALVREVRRGGRRSEAP